MSDDHSGRPPEPEIGAQLRERMQEAVSRLEPRVGTLEFLQSAVTARRKQRRAAVATSAMMLVAVGAGVAFAGRDLVRGGNGASASLGLQSTGTVHARVPGPGPGRGAAGGQAPASDVPQLAYPVTSASLYGSNATSQGAATLPVVAPVSGPPGLPGCQRSSLAAVQTTQEPTVDGIMYDTITATVKTACKVSGPPRLYVYDAGGVLSTDVPVYRADTTLAPGLPPVDTWGRTMLMGPGDKYSFELAWAPAITPCVAEPSGSPTASKSEDPTPVESTTQASVSPPLSALAVFGTSTTSPPDGSGRGTRPPRADYTIAYSVNGAPNLAMIPLVAGCGSAVYVTDIYPSAEYPEQAAVQAGTPSPS